MSAFHPGEQTLHKQLGISEKMELIGKQFIRDYMPEQHQIFYQQLPYIWIGFVDKTNAPWATMIFNPQNQLINIQNDTHLAINFDKNQNDNKLQPSNIYSDIGLLGIEPHTRRRNRLTASIKQWTEQGLQLEVKQSFGNCPKYIQARQITSVVNNATGFANSQYLKYLNQQQTSLIENADTFYIASFHQDTATQHANQGADVSHRGGLAGFVKVEGNSIFFPDYTGNQFFNTLGNIQQNGLAGLTFIDYEHGHMLQLTGTAKIVHKHELLAHFDGALRFVQFNIKHGYWTEYALPFRLNTGEQSPSVTNTGSWHNAQKLSHSKRLTQLQISPAKQLATMFNAGLHYSFIYKCRK